MKLKQITPSMVGFKCPGCGDNHTFKVGEGGWSFNGDLDNPTVQPSLLVTSGHFVDGWTGPSCWCTYGKEHPEHLEQHQTFKCYRCHFYITNGRIEFLGDCSHDLKSQTVDLLEIANG